MLGCCDERVEKTSLLGRTRGHSSAIGDVLPGASHHLPRVGLFKPKDVRDITIWIVERLPKDVGSSFGGRQLFQQQQNPKRQCLASFRSQSRVGAGIDWFRQPGPDGTHVSEAECCADRRFAPGAAAGGGGWRPPESGPWGYPDCGWRRARAIGSAVTLSVRPRTNRESRSPQSLSGSSACISYSRHSQGSLWARQVEGAGESRLTGSECPCRTRDRSEGRRLARR